MPTLALKWSDGIQTVVESLLEVITGGAFKRTLQDPDDQFRELATMSPRQAIAEKWEQLEKAILAAGTRNQVPIQPNDGEAPSQIVNALHQRPWMNLSIARGRLGHRLFVAAYPLVGAKH
jgi:hypothetical protein